MTIIGLAIVFCLFVCKLWMMKGQIHEEEKDMYEAQQAFRNGVSNL